MVWLKSSRTESGNRGVRRPSLHERRWGAEEHDFAAAWRSQPKWVVSRTLKSVGPNATLVEDGTTQRTRRFCAPLLEGTRPRTRRLLASLSSPREQDRETNGLISTPGTGTPSAANQTIESAAESEIGPTKPTS